MVNLMTVLYCKEVGIFFRLKAWNVRSFILCFNDFMSPPILAEPDIKVNDLDGKC